MPSHVRKGDLVRIIAGTGRKEKKIGKVLRVIPDQNRVVVEGVNVHKKHVKATQQNPRGSVIEKELSIHISNVQPVVDGKPTRVRFQTKPDGSKHRIAATTGATIGQELRKATK